MQHFGDEVGLLWSESRASAQHFARGMAEVSLHNPLRVRFEEKLAERQRNERRRASLRAQLAAADENDSRILDELNAILEAAITFEETGEIDRRLVPECEEAIQAELTADSRQVMQAADMQAIPEFNAAAKELGWEFEGARSDGDRVYVTHSIKREQIANVPETQPTRQRLRQNIEAAMSRFHSQATDRTRIVADVRQMIARVLTPLQPAAP